MKTVILVLAGIAVIAVAVYVLGSVYAPADMSEPAGEISGSDEQEVRGTVVLVDTSQVPVDGPALVRVRAHNGNEFVVAVPSMGINLCPAQPNIADVSVIRTGSTIEVRGEASSENRIVPCESPDHYLRIAE
jgi:hypothetical protein